MRRAAAPSLRRAAPPPCSAASLRRRFAARAEPASQSVPVTPLTLALPPFARSADGAALASQGATSVLATIVANRLEPRWHRELNLIVDYREPNAGHGRIPANATKRDGAPMLKEMQNAALIEECMAAAFPDTYLCETQLHVSVLAQEGAHYAATRTRVQGRECGCGRGKGASDDRGPCGHILTRLRYRLSVYLFLLCCDLRVLLVQPVCCAPLPSSDPTQPHTTRSSRP